MTVPIGPSAAGSRISGRELADLLGQWSASDGPLYRLLADRISRLADSGELPSGLRLPPERELAGALSVSRNTAAAAYQALRDEGVAQTRQGAGTQVTAHVTTPAAVHRANGFFASLLESARVEVDLTLAHPDCAPAVAEALNNPATVVGPEERRETTSSSGYYPLGMPLLRAVVADRLTARHHLPTSAEQVLITTGSQQAIDLLMRSLSVPGQSILLEDPTFPGAVDALHRSGARPVAIPAGRDADFDRLAHLIATHRPALVYLIPTHHNPTGWVMPPDQRMMLAELAARHPDTVFVEDATLAELALGPPPGGREPRHLAAASPLSRNVVTIGSLSKTYWGGLRTGWIRASKDLIRRLAAAKAVSDLGSPVFQQAVVAGLIASRHDEILRWRVGQLRARRDVLEEALRAHLPEWSWTSPAGGLSLWARLPQDSDAGSFAQTALRRGVAVVPGRLLSPTNRDHHAVRIAYIQPPGQLQRAAPLLAAAWRAVAARRAG